MCTALGETYVPSMRVIIIIRDNWGKYKANETIQVFKFNNIRAIKTRGRER